MSAFLALQTVIQVQFCFMPNTKVILPSFNIPKVWRVRLAMQVLRQHFEVAPFILFSQIRES